MTLQQLKTQFDLEEIVKRCFAECVDAKCIEIEGQTDKHAMGSTAKIIINEDQVASHISKTIIGELLEFEIIRRMTAVSREAPRIDRDLEYITSMERIHNEKLGIRIGEK